MIKELKDKTSEDLHKIAKQPEPTCPMIDEAITKLGKALNELKGWERDSKREDFESLSHRCEYAEWHGSDVERFLEKVRTNTELIRIWGQEWKDLALQLIDEKSQPNTFEGKQFKEEIMNEYILKEIIDVGKDFIIITSIIYCLPILGIIIGISIEYFKEKQEARK